MGGMTMHVLSSPPCPLPPYLLAGHALPRRLPLGSPLPLPAAGAAGADAVRGQAQLRGQRVAHDLLNASTKHAAAAATAAPSPPCGNSCCTQAHGGEATVRYRRGGRGQPPSLAGGPQLTTSHNLLPTPPPQPAPTP